MLDLRVPIRPSNHPMANLNVRATCHPNRLHAAKGLCAACYAKQHHDRNREKRNAQARVRYQGLRVGLGLTKPAPCHPDRPLHAKGLCAPCYQVQYRRGRKQSQPCDRVAALPVRAVAVGLGSGRKFSPVLRPVQAAAFKSAASFFGRGSK